MVLENSNLRRKKEEEANDHAKTIRDQDVLIADLNKTVSEQIKDVSRVREQERIILELNEKIDEYKKAEEKARENEALVKVLEERIDVLNNKIVHGSSSLISNILPIEIIADKTGIGEDVVTEISESRDSGDVFWRILSLLYQSASSLDIDALRTLVNSYGYALSDAECLYRMDYFEDHGIAEKFNGGYKLTPNGGSLYLALSRNR